MSIDYRNKGIIRELAYFLNMSNVNMFIIPANTAYKRPTGFDIADSGIISDDASRCLPIFSSLKKLSLSSFFNKSNHFGSSKYAGSFKCKASFAETPYMVAFTIRPFSEKNCGAAVLAYSCGALGAMFLWIVGIIISRSARMITESLLTNISNLSTLWNGNDFSTIKTSIGVGIIKFKGFFTKDFSCCLTACAASVHQLILPDVGVHINV